MLDVYKSEDGKVTTSVINGSEMDAVRRVSKVILGRNGAYENNYTMALAADAAGKFFHFDKLRMKDRYSGTVRLHEGDEPNEEVGTDEAVKKVMRTHNRSFRKAIIAWQIAVLSDVKAVSPDTFDEAVKNLK